MTTAVLVAVVVAAIIGAGAYLYLSAPAHPAAVVVSHPAAAAVMVSHPAVVVSHPAVVGPATTLPAAAGRQAPPARQVAAVAAVAAKPPPPCVGGGAVPILVGYLRRTAAAGAALMQWIDANPTVSSPFEVNSTASVLARFVGAGEPFFYQLRSYAYETAAMCQVAITMLTNAPTAASLAAAYRYLQSPFLGGGLTIAQMESTYYGGCGPGISLGAKLSVPQPNSQINPVQDFPGFGPLVAAFDAQLLGLWPVLGAVAAAAGVAAAP